MPPKLEVTALETKITQLKRAIGKTETIVNNGKEQAIVRHVDTIKETLSEVNKLRREIEATKISEGVNDEEIDEWNSEIESVMESGDEAIEKLQEWLKTKESRLEEIQQEQKAEREKQEQEKRIEFELKLHEAKIKMQAEAEVSVKPTSGKEEDEVSKLQAKLPKLQISEFNASYKDWPRFWNLYSETIHKSSIPAVSKFSYLKELLCEKARKTIEALPHTAEGYNRATAILKDRFGKECEIVKCFVKEIMELPHIPTANVKKIHEFHDKLAYCVQSLETLKKLDAVNGTVSMTLEKLPAIRGDLARNDTKWEDWTYVQLTEALQFWTRRNPLDSPKHDDTQKKREQPRGCFHTQQKGGAQPGTRKACVYCDKEEHRSSECKSVTTVGERRKILARKKLCFNCNGPSHRASDCRSTSTCKNCKRRHHTSICDVPNDPPKPEAGLTASKEGEQGIIYPIVLIEIDGVKTHALLDTGSGSSYASVKLISVLKKKANNVKTRRIETMLGSTTTKVETYTAKLSSVDGKFVKEIELSKVHKSEIMMVKTPNYESLLAKYNHLNGIKIIADGDDREQIPIHVVLSAGEYAAIKTSTPLRIGSPGQPVAEKT